jgi:preprotein translocase subunit SecE
MSEHTTNIKLVKNKTDIFLWSIIVILLISGIITDRYFTNVTWALKLAGWIVLACVLVFMGKKTDKGQRFWRFIKEARNEMRKVVWPSRQETTKTTLLVSGMVLVAALLLWSIDSILLVFIGWLTGQG